MTSSLHHFSPATTGETMVYGACRPGYPSRTVSHSAVQQWIAFMRAQQIARVVCLLPTSQLRYYSNVLGLYREAFGPEKLL